MKSVPRGKAIWNANGGFVSFTDTLVMGARSAQRKRATMLYFAKVYLFIYFFYGRLILRPWLTEVRESFTHGGP